MILQSASSASFASATVLPQLGCPCGNSNYITSLSRTQNFVSVSCSKRKKRLQIASFSHRNFRRKWGFQVRAVSSDGTKPLNIELAKSTSRGAKSFVVKQFSNELEGEELAEESPNQLGSNFTNFQEDPIVDKLRTQLGVIHPIPSPPLNRNIVGLFVFFFFVGVAFDKLWTSRKKKNKLGVDENRREAWPQVPTSFSLFLEKDLQRKESVEWVNMVLGKLWKVYRGGIENWLIGLLQPVIDNLKKPDYVERVEIKQFSLGDEPLSVRNVERRTSRRVNDLQ